MNEAKIRLSAKEMELVTNADWILTKNAIIQKTKGLLEILLQRQQEILESYRTTLPIEVVSTTPKISKGENYRGLPYLVLDHPRYFNKENIFAIRTMFWWGHFFSSTLHLSGQYKQQAEERIINAYPTLNSGSISINDDEWEHHFDRENYVPVRELDEAGFSEQVRQKKFLKLAYAVPLHQWDDALVKLEDHFTGWLKLLAD